MNNDVLMHIVTLITKTDKLSNLQNTCKTFRQVITKFQLTKSILVSKFINVNKKYDAIENNKLNNYLVCVDIKCHVHRIHTNTYDYSMGNVYFYYKDLKLEYTNNKKLADSDYNISYIRRFIPYCRYCINKYANFAID